METTLSNILKSAREAKGVDIETAAAQIQISAGRLQIIELNPMTTPLHDLYKVLEHLDPKVRDEFLLATQPPLKN